MDKPHRAKKSKKNRKHGRGTMKVSRSRFGSYANLFKASEARKHRRMAARKARLLRRALRKLAA